MLTGFYENQLKGRSSCTITVNLNKKRNEASENYFKSFD